MLIAPTKLRGDLLSLAELGADPRALLRGSDVTFEQIVAQHPVRSAKIAEIYDRLAAAAPDDFAFTCGRSIRSQYLGLLGYRLSNCATVGDMLIDWAELSINIGYPLIAEFGVTDTEWRMTFRPRFAFTPRAESFCVVSTLAGFTRSVFNLSGHHIRLHRMGFPGPSMSGIDALLGVDTDEFLFDCPAGFVEGARADLDLPIAAADADLLRLCDDLCRQAWSRMQEPATLAQRLATLFNDAGPLGLAEASASLGMSVRSFQRRLASEDSSYHLVLDAYRRDRAMQLVDRGQQSKTAAYELGYEDESSFRRSFKRWTGSSPTRWKQGS